MDVDEEEIADFLAHDFLEHYGKAGMKWGVRKNASRAFGRSAKKATRLDTRSAKIAVKGAKQTARGQKRMAKATRWYSLNPTRNLVKGLRIQAKGSAKALKSVKLSQKSLKWKAEMLKQFKDVKVSQISDKDKALGKSYIEYLLSD